MSSTFDGLSLTNSRDIKCNSIFLNYNNNIENILNIFSFKSDISDITGLPPETLNSLQELATAIGDNPFSFNYINQQSNLMLICYTEKHLNTETILLEQLTGMAQRLKTCRYYLQPSSQFFGVKQNTAIFIRITFIISNHAISSVVPLKRYAVLQEVIVGIIKTDIQAFRKRLKVTYITKNLDKLHD